MTNMLITRQTFDTTLEKESDNMINLVIKHKHSNKICDRHEDFNWRSGPEVHKEYINKKRQLLTYSSSNIQKRISSKSSFM